MADTEPEVNDLENGSGQNFENWLKPRADTGVAWCMRILVVIAVLVIAAELAALIYLGVQNSDLLLKPGVNPGVVKPFEWTGSRLPPNISLSKEGYDLDYKVSIAPSSDLKTFNGSLHVQILTLSELEGLVMHSKDLAVSKAVLLSASLDGTTTRTDAKTISYNAALEYLFLTWPNKLAANTKYDVYLEWQGVISNQTEGLYRSTYINPTTGSPNTMLATQMEPNYARRVFPCFDEPAYRAYWTLELVVPTSMPVGTVALANMRQDPATDPVFGSANITYTFERTSIPISPYLVAFVIGKLEFIEDHWTSEGISKPLRVYVQAGQQDYAKFALDSAKKFLAFFEDYTNREYVFPKLDMVAIPDFAAGAMENPGLITYRETALLLDDAVVNSASFASRGRVAEVVAHELAHQWFGNLLTPAWWDDLWVAEGSATYFSYLALESVYPEWKYTENHFFNEEWEPAMGADELIATHPLTGNVTTVSDARAMFDTTTYSKGASILSYIAEMIKPFSSGRTFKQTLNEAMSKTSGSLMTSLEYLKVLTSGVGNPTNTLSWPTALTNYTVVPSFPVVVFSETGNTVTQTTYFSLFEPPAPVPVPVAPVPVPVAPVPVPVAPGTPTPVPVAPVPVAPVAPPVTPPVAPVAVPPTWYLPVSYIKNGGLTNRVVLTGTEKTRTTDITASTTWYKANPNGASYYRVMYPVSNWNKLITAIQANDTNLTPHDRANLISDAFTWAEIGKLNYSIPFRLAKAALSANETHPVVWRTALHELQSIAQLMRTDASYCFGDFSTYMSSLLTPAFDYWTWEIDTIHGVGLDGNYTTVPYVSSAGDVLLRTLILSTGAEYITEPNYSSFAVDAVADYVQDPSNDLPHDTAAALLRVAVRNSPYTVWNELFQLYLQTANPTEKSRLLAGLASTNSRPLAKELLKASLDPTIVRPQDQYIVLRTLVQSSDFGVNLIWDFFRDNFQQILRDTPQNLGSWVSVLSNLVSPRQLDEVSHFFTIDHPSLGISTGTIQSITEVIRDNHDWLDAFVDDICAIVKV